jgi:hypothetical protein
MILSGQNLAVQFTVSGSSGLTDPDATPTAVLVVDGTDTATSVTVTKVATGIYKATCTLPSLTAGQCVSVRVSADVAGVPLGAVVFSDVIGVMPDNASIAGIKAKTDGLSFVGSDVKATLDGETVTVATNNDKTGYSLTAAYDAAKVAASQTSVDALSGRLTDVRAAKLDNLDAAVSSRLAASAYTAPANADISAIKAKTDNLAFVGTDVKATLDGETVTVATNNDKTGYSLTAAYDAAKVAASQASVDTLSSRLTAERAASLDNLDATVSSRLAASAYVAPAGAAEIADAVWDEPLTSHTAPDSAGERLNSRLAAADYVAPPTANDVASAVDAALAASHGEGPWAPTLPSDVIVTHHTLDVSSNPIGVLEPYSIITAFLESDTMLSTPKRRGIANPDGTFTIPLAAGAIYKLVITKDGTEPITKVVSV